MPSPSCLLLQTCKLSVVFFLGLFFIPFLIFGLVIITLFSFVFIPIVCILLSVYVLSLLMRQLPVRSLVKASFHFCFNILNSSPSIQKEDNQIHPREEQHRVSVEFDPSEIPSVEESEEDDRTREDISEELSMEEDDNNKESWQIQTLQSIKQAEDKPINRNTDMELSHDFPKTVFNRPRPIDYINIADGIESPGLLKLHTRTPAASGKKWLALVVLPLNHCRKSSFTLLVLGTKTVNLIVLPVHEIIQSGQQSNEY
ncbi:hypothetical protein IFM89_011475 [Coptis chinensis]|uniref:Uncharacterized protein n=1 Tax=Coptis chinensis TaxID=261450 RepID=A0A835IYB1_9MAGN|nr:hypothetical protein IFM89_011475 [Coptis chinensis]